MRPQPRTCSRTLRIAPASPPPQTIPGASSTSRTAATMSEAVPSASRRPRGSRWPAGRRRRRPRLPCGRPAGSRGPPAAPAARSRRPPAATSRGRRGPSRTSSSPSSHQPSVMISPGSSTPKSANAGCASVRRAIAGVTSGTAVTSAMPVCSGNGRVIAAPPAPRAASPSPDRRRRGTRGRTRARPAPQARAPQFRPRRYAFVREA